MGRPDSEAIDIGAIRSSLSSDGYVVVPGIVPRPMCRAVLDAIKEVLGIDLDDPATWSSINDDFDQVPMWGHRSQWNIRQLPVLHAIWSAIWGRADLWADINSCRVTRPWGPGAADELPIHFDVDPHDTAMQWFPGLVALTDATAGHGGFRCVPSLFRDPSRWPTTWRHAGQYQPELADGDEIIEVPLNTGDLLIWDSHLPHGTVRNHGPTPRAVFYLQLHPPGTPDELEARLADIATGQAPPWVRWKPGHDRLDRHDLELTELGSRLLGSAPSPRDEHGSAGS